MDGRTVGCKGYLNRMGHRTRHARRALCGVSYRCLTVQSGRRCGPFGNLYHCEISTVADTVVFMGGALHGLAVCCGACDSQFPAASTGRSHWPASVYLLQSLTVALSASN